MADETAFSKCASNAALFSFYVAAVLTVVMGLFPPFTSLNGTEYAFVLTGPAWARSMGALGEDLGLAACIHWMLLLVQLAAVWAIAFGAKRFLTRAPTPQAPVLLLALIAWPLAPDVPGPLLLSSLTL